MLFANRGVVIGSGRLAARGGVGFCSVFACVTGKLLSSEDKFDDIRL